MQDLTQTNFDYSTLDLETRVVVQQKTSEIKTLMKRAASDIIEIGQKLVEVKGKLEHGEFGNWLQSEFAWSERTAQRFMHVATRFKSDTVSDLAIAPSALYLLASPSTPEAAVEEALIIAREGVEVTGVVAREIVEEYKPAYRPIIEPAPSATAYPTTEETLPVPTHLRPQITPAPLELEESQLRPTAQLEAWPEPEPDSTQELDPEPTDSVQSAFGCASCKHHLTKLNDLNTFTCTWLGSVKPLQSRRQIGGDCRYYKCSGDFWQERLPLLGGSTPLPALMVTPVEVLDFLKTAALATSTKAITAFDTDSYQKARWQEIQTRAITLLETLEEEN